MEIKRIQTGNVNCYLVCNGENAVLVDTGRENGREKVLDVCRGLHVNLLFLTHGHIDHVQNAAFLAEKLSVPIAMHRADLPLLTDNMAQPLSAGTFLGKIVLAASVRSFRKDKIEPFAPSVFLKDGDTLDKWGIPASVVGLPGHTAGSLGLDVEGKHLLVGDALMNMFYPTVSMLYCDERKMLRSAGKISGLRDRTIWFGHGKPVDNRNWHE